METITVPQDPEVNRGWHSQKIPVDSYITKAVSFANVGDNDSMMLTISEMPLQEVADKNGVYSIGITLIDTLARGIASGEDQYEGYLRLEAYFSDSNITGSSVPMYAKLLQSSIDDSIVQDYLNCISNVNSYNSMFNYLMIDETVRFSTVERFDRMIKTSDRNYVELATLYLGLKEAQPEKYQLILNNIARSYVMEKPSYIIEPKESINHYDEVDRLLSVRQPSNLIDHEDSDYPLDLYELGSLIAEANLDNNLLFAEQARANRGVGHVDEDCKILIGIYKFLVVDPLKRKAICEKFDIEYDDELLANDIEEFRMFGPCNPVGYESYDIVEQRMLTSYFHNNVTEAGEPYYNDLDVTVAELTRLNGFNGVCERCGIHIPYEHYAVRIPIAPPIGGWGTKYYHDWNCAINEAEEPMSKEMIKIHMEQMNAIGIYDRNYNNEYRSIPLPDQFNVAALLKDIHGDGVDDEEEVDDVIEEDPDIDINNSIAEENIRQLLELRGISNEPVLGENILDNIADSLDEATSNQEFIRVWNSQLEEVYSMLDSGSSSIVPPFNQFNGRLPIEVGGEIDDKENDLNILQDSNCDPYDIDL